MKEKYFHTSYLSRIASDMQGGLICQTDVLENMGDNIYQKH